MAQVDTSFYNQQPQPDIMGGIGKTVGVANALTQNRGLNTEVNMLQSEYGAQKAQGSALLNAIGPDGKFNSTNAFSNLSSNPAAGYGILPIIQGVTATQGGQISNAGASAQNAQNYAVNFASAINALPDSATPDDIRAATDQLNAEGRISPDMAIAIHSDPALSKQNALQYARTRALGVVAPATQLTTTAGAPNPVTGQPTITTQGEQVKAVGANPPGTVSTSLEPASNESINEYIADLKGTAPMMESIKPAQSALPLIEQLSAGNFGPGSADLSKIRSAFIQAGIIGADSPAATQEAMLEAANKYLAQNVVGAPGAGRSDAALDEINKANPRTGLVQPAALALVKNQIGRQLFTANMQRAYDADPAFGKAGPAGYLKYKSGANQNGDYHAYNWSSYTPAQQKAYIDSIGGPKSDGAKKFLKSYQDATRIGLQSPPPASGAQ